MQDRELEELALDWKELLFLLRESGTRKELLPIAERHINRLVKTLEEIRNGLNDPAPGIIEQPEPAAGLSKELTLNDTFRLSRELFDGDKDEMNRASKM